ncbi:L-fucokinase-domain-containing protein [Jimgerdemannia flammicorona]|uniref:L-fucokinase-domain-containing protein n=1 Tax=Jimgerdemannia flammicorona TaxID=994334 RepID=A0A433PSZ4_9FUNG|nr:L-fucokinase-domain-containing protein [Jimgerdemannia flammicorona]
MPSGFGKVDLDEADELHSSRQEGPTVSKVLRASHLHNVTSYCEILSSKTKEEHRFWDVVVITACDDVQKQAYELQVQQRIKDGEIPMFVKYHVIADPPGPKIGSGGSTFIVLKFLREHYGSLLDSLLVLLIHAGGYCKRMPHVSAIGKIFTNIPAEGTKGTRMLNLKMILYMKLAQSMGPGVFLTSADGIELFASNGDHYPFASKGFTALAHPSSLFTGTTHGVFCIDDPRKRCAADFECSSDHSRALLQRCDRFLHKPSVEHMRKMGAVFLAKDGCEYVYTDSAYFFDHETGKTMVDILDEITPLTFELEAWADFLPFGTKQHSTGHVTSASNLVDGNIADDALRRARKTIIDRLQEAHVELNVMVLNTSKFHHVGTMEEYLELCCVDPDFREQLAIGDDDDAHRTLARSSMVNSNGPANEKTFGRATCETNVSDTPKPANNCTIPIWKATECTFDLRNGNLKCHIAAPALLEYCILGENVNIGPHSILSNLILPASTKIPAATCMFTLRLQVPSSHTFLGERDTLGYVTFVFSTKDDIKHETEPGQLFVYGDIPLSYVCQSRVHLKTDCKNSLWEARVYPVARTERDATLFALDMVKRILKLKEEPSQIALFNVVSDEAIEEDEGIVGLASLADAVAWKVM